MKLQNLYKSKEELIGQDVHDSMLTNYNDKTGHIFPFLATVLLPYTS